MRLRDELRRNLGMDNELLNTKDAARYLAVSTVTLARWRSQGLGPRWAKLEGSVRYRLADLREFVEHGLVRGGAA